jgi:hypothetical protein
MSGVIDAVEAKTFQKGSFARSIGRPLVFGAINVPNQFVANLKKIDVDNVFDFQTQPKRFWEHDITVIFVESWASLKANDQYSALETEFKEITPESYSYSIWLKSKAEKEVLIMFYRKDIGNVDYVCLAQTLLTGVTRGRDEASSRLIRSCYE